MIPARRFVGEGERRSSPLSALVAFVCLFSGGCSDEPRCGASGGCPAGHSCVASSCRLLCNQDGDCGASQVCIDGVCESDACASAEDCVRPRACHVSAGATCDAGICSYPLAGEGVACVAAQDRDGNGVQDVTEQWSGQCRVDGSCAACPDSMCYELSFVRVPSVVGVGESFSVHVLARDRLGRTLDGTTTMLTLELAGMPAGQDDGALLGNVTAPLSHGVAVFDGVWIDVAGAGVTLRVVGAGLRAAVSDPISVEPRCAPWMAAYWPLDDIGPPFADLLGGSSATCTTCPVMDPVEQARHFDTATAVQVPGGSPAPFNWTAAESFTVESWVKADPTACETTNEVFVGRAPTAGSDTMHWWLGCETADRSIRWLLTSSDGTLWSLAGPNLIDGAWHHVVGMRDAVRDEMLLFVDGDVRGAAWVRHGSFAEPNSEPLNIGWFDGSIGYNFQGLVNNVALYDRVLSAAQVSFLHQLGPRSPLCNVAPPVCGNGIREVGEVCDDGNVASGDGCSSECLEEQMCPEGLTHYWRFDDAGASRLRDSVAGALLGCGSDPLYETTARPCANPVVGRFGEALRFDGETTGLALRTPASLAGFDWAASDSFSVELWMRGRPGVTCAGADFTANEVIVGRDDASVGLQWWVGCHHSGGAAVFELGHPSTVFETVSGPAINDGDWHHVVAVRDGTAEELRIYVDAGLPASVPASYTLGFASDVPVNVGWLNSGAGYHFDGLLDGIAVYDRALTAEEVAAHYAAGSGTELCTAP